MKDRVVERIERVFRPEFLNRLDDTIVFRHLQEGDLKSIVEFELSKVRGQLADKGLALELTDDAKQFLINKGTNLDMGARPLRRLDRESRDRSPLGGTAARPLPREGQDHRRRNRGRHHRKRQAQAGKLKGLSSRGSFPSSTNRWERSKTAET